MRREFLDYVEDIIEAMKDAMNFVEGIFCSKCFIYTVLEILGII
ncbi:MAG: hypothetical protein QXK55_07780 [Nitrososphaeria archaeon]